MLGCEARVGLTTSSLPVGVIARLETEEDLLDVTPIRPDYDNDISLSRAVESPDFSRESEENIASLSPSPSGGPVSSAENHRVAQHIKEIKRRCREAAKP
ncbi:hypothetical protein PoB_005928400 [Plakobranchus ocellatus]|uniref:Uncharacterized protein n=1 Tax=Plakobranchus ocellatus TaxID=259542 RepID=A0AAV4CJ04_9GAST|nr:hypothetical protein PoB_005928400 [Plakobranchus ocellatus]